MLYEILGHLNSVCFHATMSYQHKASEDEGAVTRF
jgi:hypothetical protein